MKFDEVKTKLKTDPFIDGERISSSSKETYTSKNPSTNEEFTTFPLCNAEDVNKAVAAARKAFDQGPWPRMSVKERTKLLRNFADLIEENAKLLGAIESYDVGKLLPECVNHDVARASANIRFFAERVTQAGDEVFFNDAAFLGKKIKTISVTRRDPIGVAGLIVPWNSPIMLATWKIGPCLATGNTCVVKPSPWALLSILQLGELAKEAGIPDGVLNIVPGGVDAGKALVAHPGVNRVSFTGSVRGGKEVNQSNAETRMEPVSLELGGKSPTIVFADADLECAVKGVSRGIFRSQGQSCVAGSRLLLDHSIYQEFMEALVKNVSGMKVGDQLDEESDIGPVITTEHMQNVMAMIKSGIDEGAKATIGGKQLTDGELSKGNYVAPTVFENVTAEMKIWKEEIFGPVLVIMPFSSEAEALHLANDTCFGLSSSVWTNNYERALRVAGAIEAGMTWVNSHFVRDLRSPFGGIKESGIGSEGGRYSLEFYTKPKMMCFPYPPAEVRERPFTQC